MKKILLLFILILLLPGVCFAGNLIGSGVVVTGGCTPCSWLDTGATYGINFDYSATCGTPTETEQRTGCTDTGTLVGTLTTASISNTYNHTSGGSYSLLGETDGSTPTDSYMEVPNTGNKLTSSQGAISVWAIPTENWDDNVIFYATGNGGYIRIWIEKDSGTSTTKAVKFYFSAGSLATIQTTALVTLGIWNLIEVSWSVDLDTIRIRINSGTTESTTATFTAWTSDPTSFYIGALWGDTAIFSGGLDDFQIYQTDDLLD